MWKKTIVIFLLSTFCLTVIFGDWVTALAQEANQLARIAVFPLTDSNNAARTEGNGEAIAGMLMTELINGSVFEMIERSEINKIMDEIGLGQIGAVDSETAIQIGKIYNVNMLVFGSVAKFGQLVETDIRLVDTQSGRALMAENASSNSNREIRNMVQNLARKIEQRYQNRFLESVQITSEPAGADIFINDEKYGPTPFTASLNQGEYTIRLMKNNYSPWEQVVTVIAGENTVNAKLSLAPAYLKKLEDEKRLAEQKAREQKMLEQNQDGGSNALMYILGGAVLVGGAAAAIILLKPDPEEEKSKVSVTVTIP